VLWPTGSHERVPHPVALPAHDRRITAQDVNRGDEAKALTGREFTAAAAAPATPTQGSVAR
jgi:hypothetical protein